MTRKQVEVLSCPLRERAKPARCGGHHGPYFDDVVVESPMAGGPVRGRAAVEGVNHAWIAVFPDATFTRETLVIRATARCG